MNLMQLKESAKKLHYVFVGQNATTGTPHSITGNLSFYGSIAAFKTKRDAMRFVAEFRSNNPSEFAVAGTHRTLRKYKLGCSLYHFYTDYLLLQEPLSYDVDGNLI